MQSKADELDTQHLNAVVRAFGIDTVVQWIEAVKKANPNSSLVSVGSGNGAIESLVGALCVDPDPLSYGSTGLKAPYCAPTYARVTDLIAAEPAVVGNAILLLGWCPPNDSRFDHEAIMLLKPRAVISLYEIFDYGGGAAGGSAFHTWRESKSRAYHLIKEACLQRHDDYDLDLRIGWWQLAPLQIDLPEIYPSQISLNGPCANCVRFKIQETILPMSQADPSSFKNVLVHALNSGAILPQTGKVTLVIWDDEGHFNEWANLADKSKDVRVIEVEFEHMPMIVLPPDQDPSTASVIAAAFGSQPDYSDVVLKYYQSLRRK